MERSGNIQFQRHSNIKRNFKIEGYLRSRFDVWNPKKIIFETKCRVLFFEESQDVADSESNEEGDWSCVVHIDVVSFNKTVLLN